MKEIDFTPRKPKYNSRLLHTLVDKYGRVRLGVRIPRFNFNAHMSGEVNFCEGMSWYNNMNVSGGCGKAKYWNFPRRNVFINPQPQRVNRYERRCGLCSRSACPPELRNRCILEAKKRKGLI